MSKGTPFFCTSVLALVPFLLDLLHPRYLYKDDAEMFVFASVVVPYVRVN